MLYLDLEDNSKIISMYINSPGGSVTAGFAMFDTMRHIKSEVSTINVGLAASMGSFLLVGGTKGKRLALPHSRTMIHQPMGGARGQASDIKVEAEQILSIRERVVKYYSELSGQPKEKVQMDLDRDNFLSAQQALEYGLIDTVIQRPGIGPA
jgi:ATP-dependent Clp endopeptidase proteolytic subunit ClpP